MRAMNKLRILRSVSFAVVAAVLVAGCASTPGSYRAGLALLIDKSDFKDSSLFQGSQDRSNVGWKLFGQYDPGQKDKIVFEGGYQQLGDTKFDGLYQGTPDQGTIETTTIEVSVGYLYPFTERFSAGGRLGAASVDVDEREVFGGVPESSSASETIPFGGVMFRFGIGDNWGLTAQWNLYPDVGKVGQTGEGDINVYGIGADFRFGGSNSD